MFLYVSNIYVYKIYIYIYICIHIIHHLMISTPEWIASPLQRTALRLDPKGDPAIRTACGDSGGKNLGEIYKYI